MVMFLLGSHHLFLRFFHRLFYTGLLGVGTLAVADTGGNGAWSCASRLKDNSKFAPENRPKVPPKKGKEDCRLTTTSIFKGVKIMLE